MKGVRDTLFGAGIGNLVKGFFDLQYFVHINLRDEMGGMDTKLIRLKRRNVLGKNKKILKNLQSDCNTNPEKELSLLFFYRTNSLTFARYTPSKPLVFKRISVPR